jgi:hypothetical protein
MAYNPAERRLAGKRYDVDDPDDFHRDLQAAWNMTVSNGRKTPGLREAHSECCAGIWGVLR